MVGAQTVANVTFASPIDPLINTYRPSGSSKVLERVQGTAPDRALMKPDYPKNQAFSRCIVHSKFCKIYLQQV